MELDKTSGIIHVATGDWDLVKEVLSQFNSAYKGSKLKYLSSEEIDGVLFSYIDARDASVDHVFLFGASFGDRIREMRDKKEINW
jgi:hypothetical protein